MGKTSYYNRKLLGVWQRAERQNMFGQIRNERKKMLCQPIIS